MSESYKASFISDLYGRDAQSMNEIRMKELLVSNEKINDRGILYFHPLPHTPIRAFSRHKSPFPSQDAFFCLSLNTQLG
jgi:hypothetical protein